MKKKKILSLLIVFSMVLSLLPMMAVTVAAEPVFQTGGSWNVADITLQDENKVAIREAGMEADATAPLNLWLPVGMKLSDIDGVRVQFPTLPGTPALPLDFNIITQSGACLGEPACAIVPPADYVTHGAACFTWKSAAITPTEYTASTSKSILKAVSVNPEADYLNVIVTTYGKGSAEPVPDFPTANIKLTSSAAEVALSETDPTPEGGCENDGEVTHTWTIGPKASWGEGVGNGTTDHVLKLTVPSSLGKLSGDAKLSFAYGADGNASSRRLLAWTDKSPESAPAITYLTSARTTGGNGSNGVSASAAIVAGQMSAEVDLPTALMDSVGEIYVSLTTNSSLTTGDPFITNVNHRGGGTDNNFLRLATITLTATSKCPGCEKCCPTAKTPPEECDGCEYCKPSCPHTEVTTVAATCTEKGSKTCNNPECDFVEDIAALGHDWDVTTPATCMAKGVRACKRTTPACPGVAPADAEIGIDPTAHKYAGAVDMETTGAKTVNCGETCTNKAADDTACTNVFKCTDVDCAVCNACEDCKNGTEPPEKACCAKCGRVNPACENAECTNLSCPNASKPTLVWTINPAPQPGVSRGSTSSTNHVVALAKPDITAAGVPAGGVELTLTLGDKYMFRSSNRALLVWSDLSGTPEEVTANAFLTDANIAAGKIFESSGEPFAAPIPTTPGASATVTVPKSILVDGDKVASTIYVALTQKVTAGGFTHQTGRLIPDDQRAAHGLTAEDPATVYEFDLWKTVSLFIPCVTHDFGTECGSECKREGCKVTFKCGLETCLICTPPGACKFCSIGGKIKQVSTAPTGAVGVTNGNMSVGTETVRVGLNIDVLELIKGTQITPEMIYGIEADIWRGRTGNNMQMRFFLQDEIIDPDAEPDPDAMPLRSPIYQRITALPDGNLPLLNNTLFNKIRWMNMYGQDAGANNIGTLKPFVSNDAERFDIELHPNNDGEAHSFRVITVRLLGNATGTKCAGDDCNATHPTATVKRCDGTCLDPVVLGEIKFPVGEGGTTAWGTEAAPGPESTWSAEGEWGDFEALLPCKTCAHGKCLGDTCDTCISECAHTTIAYKELQAPTCTVAGSRQQACTTTGCTHTVGEPEVIGALGHAPDTTKWNITKAATCTEAGSRKAPCSREGCTEEVVQEITATGHSNPYAGWTPARTPENCATKPLIQTGTCTNEGCTDTQTRENNSDCGTDGCSVCGVDNCPTGTHVWGNWALAGGVGERACTAPTCSAKETCAAGNFCKVPGCTTVGCGTNLDPCAGGHLLPSSYTLNANSVGEKKCSRCDYVLLCGEQGAKCGITTCTVCEGVQVDPCDLGNHVWGTTWGLKDGKGYQACGLGCGTERICTGVAPTKCGNTVSCSACKDEPLPPTKDSLDAKIKEVEALLAGMATSTDGTDVEKGKYWVTAADKATLQGIIEAAKAVFANADATEEQIAAAITSLGSAQTTFNGAKQEGKKEPSTCDCGNCEDCGWDPVKGGRLGFGNIMGGEKPGMAEALQILRLLVKLSNVIEGTQALPEGVTKQGGSADDIRIASQITNPTPTADGRPKMDDALQLLRLIVKLSVNDRLKQYQ